MCSALNNNKNNRPAGWLTGKSQEDFKNELNVSGDKAHQQ
jgi:hypothetical protein